MEEGLWQVGVDGYEVKGDDDPSFDPRCRPWYRVAVEDQSKVILSIPY